MLNIVVGFIIYLGRVNIINNNKLGRELFTKMTSVIEKYYYHN